MLSIIIPYYYKFDNYFEECLNSVLTQSCSLLECVIVCCENEKKQVLKHNLSDKRIILVESDKLDQSSKRNKGITASSGDYILFLDCDDCLNVSFVEYCLELLNKYGQIDLIAFGYTREIKSLNKPMFNGFFENDDSKFKRIIFSEYMEEKYDIDIAFDSSCMKLFKKKIILEYEINFVEGLKCAEDAVFVMSYSSKISCAYFDDSFKSYYWRINPNSTMNSVNSGFLDLNRFAFEICKVLQSQPHIYRDGIDEYLTFIFNYRINSLASKYYNNKISYIRLYNLIRRYFIGSEYLLGHLISAQLNSFSTRITYRCMKAKSMRYFKKMILSKIKYNVDALKKGRKK